MKQINYTGSSKLISRIVSLLNRKAPLPLDGNGDPDWGTNGQVLMTDGSGSTSWGAGGGGGDTVSWTQDVTTGTKIASIDINGNSTDVYAPSGGSGGHTIEDASGTDMSAEDNLQFADAKVTDDSGNSRTKVEVIRPITESQVSSITEDGVYVVTDGQQVSINAANVVYNGGSVAGALNSLSNASGIGYDNTLSGLSATDVQDAIDEIGTNIKDRTLLCTITPTNTSVTPYSLLEAASHFTFIELLVGWQGVDVPGYSNDTVWSSGYWNTNDYGDVTRLYTNNNPSNPYAEISSKTDTGCNVKVSNASVRVAIYGLCRI